MLCDRATKRSGTSATTTSQTELRGSSIAIVLLCMVLYSKGAKAVASEGSHKYFLHAAGRPHVFTTVVGGVSISRAPNNQSTRHSTPNRRG